MKKRSNLKKLWLLPIIFLLLVIIAYFGMAFHFKDHFYFGTVINGVSYTNKTVAEVEQLISDEISHYSLKLIGRNQLEDTITSEEIDYHFVADGKVQALQDEQNPYLWFLSWIRTSNDKELFATITYDKNLLKTRAENLIFFKEENAIPPKNAKIKYNKKKGYFLQEEENGAFVIEDSLQDAIIDALDQKQDTLDLEAKDCYKSPTYTINSEPLVTFYNQIKKYSDVVITYKFGKQKEIVDHNLIHTWLKIDDKKFKVSFDEEEVRKYIDYLGYTYNTFGSKRTFQASTGKTVTVSGGDYGWLLNRPAEVESLIKAIKKGKSTTKKPVYLGTAASYGDIDFGDTFVEINLTRQHLWFYKEGNLVVESDFVSGNISRGHTTPAGVYSITYKEKDAVLGGRPGFDYNSPVTYWMPFNRNIGMHDASWRSKFGGSIYKTNGSHGCINLPIANAKKIFENISAHVPVICYNE